MQPVSMGLAAMFSRLRLLPLVMGVGGVLLVLQVMAVVQALTPSVAVAREEAAADPAEAQQAAETPAAPAEAATPEGLDPALLNRSEMALLTDLSKRRKELEEREQALMLRERLLEATEQRIEQRIGELKGLEGELNQLIGAVEEQNEERLASLVGVYERMKPKDAAKILERLDMDIQVAVATRMKQTKMAPILADMNPEAAKNLTTKLAEHKPLPSLDN